MSLKNAWSVRRLLGVPTQSVQISGRSSDKKYEHYTPLQFFFKGFYKHVFVFECFLALL